jgi:outer membrane protein TolC
VHILPLGVALLLLLVRTAQSAESDVAPTGPPLASDPLLTEFVSDALAARPELAAARATADADFELVPQAKALPDPVLSLGIQNDGFSKIEIGEMETSYWLFMASQTFPWHGKRGLRGDISTLEARQSEMDLERTRLSIQAEVGRAYIDLLLIRDQLDLIYQLESLWQQAESMARIRYETGDGAQSDLLRVQLERSRLKQRRAMLAAEDRRRAAVLNRLRGHPVDEAVATSRSLMDLPDPRLPPATEAWQDAELRSPELRRWQLGAERSSKFIDLAGKDYYPDLTVNAGVMPRGGDFEPMWQAGVSFSVPLWSGNKQSRAVAESRLREAASLNGVEAVRRLLRQRVTERIEVLGALIETNRLYRTEVLVQSDATVSSTMAEYQVGRVTFASVLEALSGYVSDVDSFLGSVAAAQRIEIAQIEVSLDASASMAPGGMSGGAVPGAGGMGSASSAPPGDGSPKSTGATGSTSMSRM